MLENDIKALIKILEESKIDKLEVSTFWGKQEIRISKNSTDNQNITEINKNIESQDSSEKEMNKPMNLESNTIGNETSGTFIENQISSHNIDPETITINAPLVGTFYRSSKPDALPFIMEGDQVKEGQIICIIEAMKIFNEIEADISGEVIKILVNDATPVEYDQELLVIAPS